MMDLPELHPEIWSHIVSFLYRPSPKSMYQCNWKELHQQDLTVAMRVNSTLYKAVSIALYHTIAVQDLSLFLQQTRAPICPDMTMERQTKEDLFKLIRSIHFHNPSHQDVFPALPSVDDKWVSTWDSHSAKAWAMLHHRVCSQEEMINGLCKTYDEAKLFESTTTVTIGGCQNLTHGWYFTPRPGLGSQDPVLRSHKSFTRLVGKLVVPQMICSHVHQGLYVLAADQYMAPKTDITLHIHSICIDDFQIFALSHNKLIIDPGAWFTGEDEDFDFEIAIAPFYRSVKRACSRTKPISENGETTLELWGATRSNYLFDKRADSAEEDLRSRLGWLNPHWAQKLLVGLIKSSLWRDAPPCEACGWTIGRWEEEKKQKAVYEMTGSDGGGD